MTGPEPRRRLAAVLAADVVGYSRLMGSDEAGTHARLKAIRKALIEPRVGAHHGRIVKLTGDGALVEFASVVDAVLCAAEIQLAVAAHDQGVSEDQQIAFRIGINIGDVIFDDADIYGDGVNVAARLETLAEPGGICVSRTVYNHVKDKIDLAFKAMGEHLVKNIAEPVTVYRVLLDADPATSVAQKAKRAAGATRRYWPVAAAAVVLLVLAGGAAWYGGRPYLEGPLSRAGLMATALPLPSKPSIAVLPFDNLSGDPEQDYFVDGVTEDLITALSRFSDLFVISRQSTFVYKEKPVDVREVGRDLGVRYVLEGSMQRAGDRIRVTAQMIDARSGHHLWAERYDRELDDVFAVQDEITQQIAATLGSIGGGRGVLQKAELKRVYAKPTDSLRAFDYYLRALELHDRFTEDDNDRSRPLFRKAIELDPDYGRAYAKLAFTYYVDYVAGWTSNPEESLAKALETAEEGMAAAPSESWIHWALAAVHFLHGRHEQSLRAYERAIALNPNDADIHAEFGLTLSYVGRAKEGVAEIEGAMRLNPYYPDWYLWNAGIAHYNAREYEGAIGMLEAYQNHTPQSRLFLAASYAQLGTTADAEAQVAEALLMAPDYTLQRAAESEPYRDRADLEHYLDGLRKAGLPQVSTHAAM